jgi:5'-3' exonuclease
MPIRRVKKNTTEDKQHNIVIMDLSYFIFYRFFATKQWYQRAHPEDNFGEDYDWSNNDIFWEKYKKLFYSTIEQYKKELKPKMILFARDCSRKDIWRNAFYSEYKANRDYSNSKIGNIFQRCYAELLTSLLDNDTQTLFKMMYVPQLEADDIIYLSIKKINNQSEFSSNGKIYVISSDHDLLQILEEAPNLTLMDAKMKSYNSKSLYSSYHNVYKKAIMGDNSDNIKKSIPKTGEKTLLELLENTEMLLHKLKDKQCFKDFCLNKLLVDFKHIPIELQMHFATQWGKMDIDMNTDMNTYMNTAI